MSTVELEKAAIQAAGYPNSYLAPHYVGATNPRIMRSTNWNEEFGKWIIPNPSTKDWLTMLEALMNGELGPEVKITRPDKSNTLHLIVAIMVPNRESTLQALRNNGINGELWFKLDADTIWETLNGHPSDSRGISHISPHGSVITPNSQYHEGETS